MGARRDFNWDAPGYIYFIRCPETGNIRVGFSETSPGGRYRTHNSGSPVTLEKFGLMHGSRRIERELHLRFARHLVKGEWFRSNASLLEFIREKAKDWNELLEQDRAMEKARMAEESAQWMSGNLCMLPARPGARSKKKFEETLPRPRGRPRKQAPKQPEKKPPARYGPLQKMLDDLKATGG